MTSPVSLQYLGDGEFRAPSTYWCRKCDDTFVIGHVHRMVEHHDRSDATHRHYFACLTNGWQSLPDHLLELYPDVETLRKRLLIRCGYADERSIVCASKAEAQRIGAFIKPMDRYAVVIVKDAVVTVFTARSQSYRAMGRDEFARSKEKVLAALDDLLGVEPGTTAKQTEAA